MPLRAGRSALIKRRSKMKKRTTLALALTLGLGMAAHASIISVDSLTSTSVESNGTVLDNMIDGSGLSAPLSEANKYTVTHTGGLNLANQYLSDNTDGTTFTFNFTSQTIGEVLVWNYSQNDLRGLDAITSVEVDTGAGFVDQSLSLTLLTANAAGDLAQVLDLGGPISGVNAIRLTVAQGITGGTQTAGGFNEVAFSSIPEPATLGMVALFGGGILFIRRKLMI